MRLLYRAISKLKPRPAADAQVMHYDAGGRCKGGAAGKPQRLPGYRNRVRAGLGFAVFLFASASAVHALDPHLQIGQYGHDSWTSQRGLPGEAVYQILQTRDGYLWVRTEAGLARFDGVRFVSMDAEVGTDSVKTIALSPEGDLLVRTTTQTAIYRNRAFVDYLPPATTLDGGTRTLFVSREHEVFVGTDNFLYKFEKSGPRLLLGNTALINAFLEDYKGKIWVGILNKLYNYQYGVLSSAFAVFPPGGATSALLEDHLHRLWAGTGTGLYRIEQGPSGTKATQQPGIPPNVSSLIEDRQGNIWVGTTNKGLARMTDGKVSIMDSLSGLTDSHVMSLLEDREGSIWIGTTSGVDRLRDTKITTFTMREGLPSNYVGSLTPARDGSIYVYCEMGGLVRIENGVVKRFDHNRPLPGVYGAALYTARDGSLWMRGHAGLSRWKDGKLTSFAGDAHFAGPYISAISEDDEGLIVANAESRVFRLKDGKATPFTIHGQTTSVTASDIYTFTIYDDPSGTLWFGTTHGLFRFIPGHPPDQAPLSGIDLAVTSIFDDGQGSLWLGGRMPGLVQFRKSDGRVTEYTKRNGLSDAHVSHILPDDAGNLWISTEDGIYTVSRRDLEDFADGRAKLVSSTRYGLADGMKTIASANTASQPGGWRTSDGRLWFATVKGLVVIDPRHIRHNDLVPPVLIETVLGNGVTQPQGDSVTIPPGTGAIELHYTALSFLVPERVRFKYQMEGYDKDWVDAGTRRVAYYTNLRPGQYRFRVIAANDDGVWNEVGDAVKIYLEPRFYQTSWFYTGCIALLLLAGLAANRLSTRLIRNRAEKLKRLVEGRTVELRASQYELEQLANFDALTALPNRRMFTHAFAQMQAGMRGGGNRFSLLLIDFDRFKHINDTFGHDAGDAFLIEAAVRLRAAVRASDCLARMGGDEFAILLAGDHDKANIERVCDRILCGFLAPMGFRGANILTSASVGVAMFPEDGDTQEMLYRSADLALYDAKRMGRNKWRWYDPDLQLMIPAGRDLKGLIPSVLKGA